MLDRFDKDNLWIYTPPEASTPEFLRDVRGVGKEWGIVFRTRADISSVVEHPLRAACGVLYDRNIGTVESSANRRNEHTAWLDLHKPSLSDENLRLALAIGTDESFDKERMPVRLRFPFDPDMRVERFSENAVSVVEQFQPQSPDWIPRFHRDAFILHLSGQNPILKRIATIRVGNVRTVPRELETAAARLDEVMQLAIADPNDASITRLFEETRTSVRSAGITLLPLEEVQEVFDAEQSPRRELAPALWIAEARLLAAMDNDQLADAAGYFLAPDSETFFYSEEHFQKVHTWEYRRELWIPEHSS